MQLYNLGNRTIRTTQDGKVLNISPKRVTEVSDDLARKLLKMYERDLTEWGGELKPAAKVLPTMTLEQARKMVAEADAAASVPVPADDFESGNVEEVAGEEPKKKKKK